MNESDNQNIGEADGEKDAEPEITCEQESEEIAEEYVAEEPQTKSGYETRPIPRRSTRRSKPPERYGDYVMQHTAKPSLIPPTPAPRFTTSLLPKPSKPIATPTPLPRKNRQTHVHTNKSHLINVVLGIQDRQCKVQDSIMSILKETV